MFLKKRKSKLNCVSDSTQVDVLNSRGQIAQEEKNYDLALIFYNEAIRIINNVNSWYGKGLTYYEMGDFNNALECFKLLKTCDKREHINTGLYNNGATEYRLGKYNNAIKCFISLLEINESSAGVSSEFLEYVDVLLYLAYCYINQGLYEEALNQIESAGICLKNNKSKKNISDSLGVIYYRQDRFTEADECFENVLKTNPKHKVALLYKGYLSLIIKKNLDMAINYFGEGLGGDAEDSANRLQLQGVIHFISLDIKKATKAFRESEKRYEEADLSQNVHARCNILFHTGKIFIAYNYPQKAEEFFKKALALKEDYKPIQEELKKLKSVQSDTKKGTYAKLNPVLEQKKSLKEEKTELDKSIQTENKVSTSPQDVAVEKKQPISIQIESSVPVKNSADSEVGPQSSTITGEDLHLTLPAFNLSQL